MKEILPVSIWYNGQMIQATILNMSSISDNLINKAVFEYQLLYPESQTNPAIQLSQGKITMDGADYQTYSSSATSNDFAYTWAAGKLNLTLV
jgi:hypothetical protein